ncbi:MarR family winged helix-turn-helix transcriptional regulator [Novosphingobium sp. MW5]|nr:MarR family winged helix-turn-helix transcriptional regulator [Novosphingobium sp. MW5]
MGTALRRVDLKSNGAAGDARGQAEHLLALAQDLARIAAELEGLVGNKVAPAGPADDQPEPDSHADLARAAYQARRLRSQFFAGPDLFGEPAWDILLDLFINANEGKSVPVTSACIGAAVPTTTALRWLSILETRGLVEREADGSDARRVFVRLTPKARASMTAYFSRARSRARNEEPHLPFMMG